MKIINAEFIPLHVEGTSPLRISKGATQVVRSVVIRLQTDSGIVGISEAVSCPPGYPEEIQEEILAALTYYLKPAIMNQDPQNISAIRAEMERVLNGKYWTKAAVINALYDLLGKAEHKPVCELLGGAWKSQVPNLSGMAGMDTPDNMVRKAMGFVESGAAVIKLKIGDTVGADLDRVRAVREAVGNKIGIRLDANSHYGAEDAVALISRLEKYDPLHIEAPIDKHDLLGLVKIKKSVGIPIMSDESVRIPMEAINLIQLNAVDIIKLKVTKMGFDLAENILRIASENGKKCILGHMLELGVAGTAEAHFALAHPELIQPHEIGSFRMIGIPDDIIHETVDAGPNSFALTHGVGLGITLNQDRIGQYRMKGPGHSG
jgi:L-Ala-D/L-Glu epimerase